VAVVSSFDTYILGRLDRERKGGCSLLLVGAGESGNWSFLQVGPRELGGCSHLPVVAGEPKGL
jgi:hypothetical protein